MRGGRLKAIEKKKRMGERRREEEGERGTVHKLKIERKKSVAEIELKRSLEEKEKNGEEEESDRQINK